MRKIVLTLAVVLLAAPVWADVEIKLADLGDGVIEISYDATGETELVRAFALNIVVTDGNITDINDYSVGDNNGGYGIFPGSFAGNISVNPTTGMVDNWVGNPSPYTPVAPPGYPDGGDIPGPAITIEMGSLYEDPGNAPGQTGVLCTVTVEVEGPAPRLCVTGNAIRGNVVLEDASEATLTPAEVCIDLGEPDCFDSLHPKYDEWVSVGKPDCWCYKYQCYGDADGIRNGNFIVGYSRVREQDLNVLVNGWKQEGYVDPATHPWICGDFDRTLNGNFIVGYARIREQDLNILIANWKSDAGIPLANPGCGGDIDLTTP